MLTTLDKILFALFTVVTIMAMFAGGWLAFLYADPLLLSDLDKLAARRNVSLIGALLFLVGMALGYAFALIVCGALSRRFVSAATHQRWAEFLDPDSLGFRRYPGIAKSMRIALIPREHRTPRDDLWSGP